MAKQKEAFSDATPVKDMKHVVSPSYEDYAQWCEHPITRYVATAFYMHAIQLKKAYVDASWYTNEPNPLELMQYRTMARGYDAFAYTKKEELDNLVATFMNDQADYVLPKEAH